MSGKIRDRFDIIMDSYNQKFFNFCFGAAFSQNILLSFFNSRTEIAGAIIGLLLIFCFVVCFLFIS